MEGQTEKQTPIQIPKKDDPLRWAMIPNVQALWVEKYAQEYGVDPDRFLLGLVLDSITGDDSPCLYLPNPVYTKEQGILGRDQLLTRLRWEMEQPQTPEELRRKLNIFVPWAQGVDLSTVRGFTDLGGAWMDEIWDFTRRLIASKADYTAAVRYKKDCDRIISPPFAAFLESQTG